MKNTDALLELERAADYQGPARASFGTTANRKQRHRAWPIC